MQSMGILRPCYQPADTSDLESGHWLKFCYKWQYLKREKKKPSLQQKTMHVLEMLCFPVF